METAMDDVTVEEFLEFIKDNPEFELVNRAPPFVVRVKGKDGYHQGEGATIREATMAAVTKAHEEIQSL